MVVQPTPAGKEIKVIVPSGYQEKKMKSKHTNSL